MEILPYVRIEKLAPTDSTTCPPGDPATYPYGQSCDTDSLPVGCTVEGWLVSPPAVDGQVVVLRCMRNGVAGLGIFGSSTVTKVRGGYFWTRNSIYRIELLSSDADPD